MSEFQKLDKYILIFDDLERSDIPINELLGYINNLVETGQVKVIVIGNQKEIDVTRLSRNQELKYIFSLLYKKLENEKSEKNDSLNKTDIKKLTDIFFRESEEYKIIKEKTFGFVYKFKPNFDPILTKFINQYFNENQRFLSLDKLTEIINKHGIINLRTVIISFINFKKIENLIKVGDFEIDLIDIKIRIFEAILYFTQKHATNNLNINCEEEPINDLIRGLREQIQYENYYTFIIDLVRDGTIKNFESGLKKLLEHIEFMSNDNIQRDLMYKLQNFIIMQDEEVEENINCFTKIVKDGSFDPKYSSVAIEIIISLSHYGFEFEDNYIEKIKELALTNLDKFEDIVRFGRVQYNDDITKNVNKELDDLANKFDSKNLGFNTSYDSNWLESFSDYCSNNKSAIHSTGLLSFINLNEFSEWLKAAKPSEIDDFRRLLLGYKIIVNAHEKEKTKYVRDLEILLKNVDTLIRQTDEVTKNMQLEFLKGNILGLLQYVGIEKD